MTGLMALIVAACAAVFPPCATEDSINCVWEGPTMGNHQGATFVDIGGEPFYVGEGANA